MKKDGQFTFRIPLALKRRLEDIAHLEGRSVAQICQAFLKAGSEHYKKKGTDSLKPYLTEDARHKQTR
jgi:predicted HicB family RNase H-like nuclease